MHKTVVIVAGGSGNRMQNELPKQFIEINGLPILMHTIYRFANYQSDIEIRIVIPKSHFNYWDGLAKKHNFNIPHRLIEGGNTRFHSVKNGINNIKKNSLVAIHDGVRPFVSIETIEKGFQTALDNGSAIPVIDVHETLRHLIKDSSKTINRAEYKLVQTPQIFNSEIILAAYNQNYNEAFTDDASVVENMGNTITLFEGNRENIKITTPDDLLIARCYANK